MLADVSKNGSIGIVGVGSYVPERVLTNEDLSKLVETSDEWITERTGIRERHIAEPDQAASDLALPAARQALEQSRLDPAELDLVEKEERVAVRQDLLDLLAPQGDRHAGVYSSSSVRRRARARWT